MGEFALDGGCIEDQSGGTSLFQGLALRAGDELILAVLLEVMSVRLSSAAKAVDGWNLVGRDLRSGGWRNSS